MSCKFEYKGKDYTELELKKELLKDPKFAQEYMPQEERYNEDYIEEDLAIFKRKIGHLQARMDVKVIMDESVDSSRVLGKSDPRTVAAGKPVILINPKQIFKTTAIHEFGHIFVDSFPQGIENPRLQKALKMLQGTELEAEVRALYPELNDEMFAKELIVTAIGRKGSEIWDSADSQGIWASIKDWMLNYLKRTFGFATTNEIESLSQELLDNNISKFNLTQNLSKTDQLEKVREIGKVGDDLKKTIVTLDSVFDQTLSRVHNIYKEYLPDSTEAREREELNRESFKTRFESITELKDSMEKLDKIDRKLGIAKYIDWVREELAKVNKTVDERVNKVTLTKDKIQASSEWNRGFDMIEDIQGLIIGLNEDGELSDKDKKYFERILGNIQKDRSILESKLLKASREEYAKFIADNDVQVRTEYERGFEKKYDDLDLSASGQSKDAYVKEKLQENQQEIWDEAYKEAYQQAHESTGDIHSLAAKWWSEKNAKSKDIQVLSVAVAETEEVIAEFGLTAASEFDVDNKKFKEDVSNQHNQSKKYETMFTTSESGQSYYTSKYNPDFLEKRNELIQDAFDTDRAEEKYGKVKVTGAKLEYTIDGVTKMITIQGATRYNVETDKDGNSVEISYQIGGEKMYLPTSEAVARSEYEFWMENNTEEGIVNGENKYIPIKSWENPNFSKLTDAQKVHLKFLTDSAREADKLTKGKDSIMSRSFNQTWIRLPGILKSDIQRVAEGNYLDSIKHKFSELTEVQADDFETQENNNTTVESFKRVFADISNKEKMRVPIPFRKKLSSEDQSFDLHTITLMNLMGAKNYQQKKELESTFLIVLDVMKNRNVPDTIGLRRMKKIHATNKDSDVPLFKSEKDIQDLKKARDMLENRVYGIKSKDAGSIDVLGKEVSVNQLAKGWLKYSGFTALVGNWINSSVNLSMGTINNMIEAMGGEHFDKSDWAKAGITYWKDSRKILDDFGTNVDKSRTNMFMNVFNVMGEKQYLDNKFEDNNRAKAWTKMSSLRPIAKAGEHMMQAKVMYATMNHIKVMDKNGEYLDINGKVVKNKKDAASLNEMIDFIPSKKGGVEMKLKDGVEATTFTRSGGASQILLETRNLIRYKVRELHGNYDADIQAAGQREFWGKMAIFLRKWVEEGYFRRWRGTGTIFKKQSLLTEEDRFFSQDAKTYREGYYVTATRFITRTLAPAIVQLNISQVSKGYKELLPHEKANLKKITAELMMISMSLLAYLSLDDDEDEVETKYFFRRQIAELSFFMLPPEAMKVVSTPTASVGTLRNIFKIITQSIDPGATYQQGPHKGRNKLTVALLKAVPISSQSIKDSKSSLDFLNNSAGIN
tara:strand:- start:1923 stop:5942 length:4020 start_codon:yes stop_codon:yes gene_type:complete